MTADRLPAPSRPLLIGIGGGSGSGKSALAQFLCEHQPDTVVIEVDNYYLDRTAIPPAERHRLNFDKPSAIEMPLLRDHLQRLRRGESVAAPIYSFSNHTRIGTRPLASAPLIVVEGLFALWWKSVRSLIDLAVYVDAVPDLRLARRICRDTLERGRSVDVVLEQYLATVRPMHERYVEPTRAHVDLIVTNDGALEDCVKCVLTALDRIRSSGAHDASSDSRGIAPRSGNLARPVQQGTAEEFSLSRCMVSGSGSDSARPTPPGRRATTPSRELDCLKAQQDYEARRQATEAALRERQQRRAGEGARRQMEAAAAAKETADQAPKEKRRARQEAECARKAEEADTVRRMGARQEAERAPRAAQQRPGAPNR